MRPRGTLKEEGDLGSSDSWTHPNPKEGLNVPLCQPV